jgi:acetyl-CoA carboxylase carboxyl transferase alpha subunit
MADSRSLLFEEVCAQDFLNFKFGDRGYQDQLNDSIAKTNLLSAVKVEVLRIPLANGQSTEVVWVAHNFGFLGGSLGCSEGEKITRAFEYALENRLPICVQCRTGGARMQEGTSSLMQMAKVSVAVNALNKAGLPFVSVLSDPTYGGVSASYAMQADVRIAIAETNASNEPVEARIGFAGPQVVLNTMCEANQAIYDVKCPTDFQFASFVKDHGQVDMILNVTAGAQGQQEIERKMAQIASMMLRKPSNDIAAEQLSLDLGPAPEDEKRAAELLNYTRSRAIDRPQTQDIISNLFDNFVELSGDGKVGKDACLRGGLASFNGTTCVVIATFKGHTPTDMQNSNYGMPSPHGYRTALRLMKMAERFELPVVTLVDTVGAWPTFECERDGQSEAIATNLTAMAGLTVPIITLMVGEGGSGGALGICMGNYIAMLSGGYFGVISPEGAASILGRYKDDKHKAEQFPKDCQALATSQCIYAHQLKDLGVVDFIIWEQTDFVNGALSSTATSEQEPEHFKSFPQLKERIARYVAFALADLSRKSADELVQQRYRKYRQLGSFAVMTEEERQEAIAAAKAASAVGGNKPVRRAANDTKASLLLQHVAEETVLGNLSKYRKLAPPSLSKALKVLPFDSSKTEYKPLVIPPETVDADCTSAKAILDKFGVQYLCREWIPQQSKKRVLITDTTMRDAHQSLLATRVRTKDIVEGALIASNLLKDAFSLECWGGATFDVCMRFLDECPWDRLREIRSAAPNILLQCLIRGANGVGYTSYPDNVVREFVLLAAKNGIDVFRVFDCFNIVENMRVSIDAIKETGKIAEVCICYTGNVLISKIYDLQYYKELAVEVVAAGADILAIKDMAGLLRPLEVEPLMRVLREAVGDNMPIHFHTHSTSSGTIATCMEMARCGCDIIDFATAAMADGTSQASLNAFLAMMQGDTTRDPQIDYMSLEPYDLFWAGVRDQYVPFESGMKSGTARVFNHQIPGGQYSNLIVQCSGIGLSLDQWSQVLDAYRDVNMLFGDIVKVTPSSKVVGDLALYLVLKGIKTSDLIDADTEEVKPLAYSIDYPASVVGLMKGELGLPHRGFPKKVEEMILRGEAKLTTRAGLVLPPINFAENRANLSAKWGRAISEEEAMSSLMYPQVFADYMKRQQSKGPLLTHLPTLVYFYALQANDVFLMDIPTTDLLSHLFRTVPAELPAGPHIVRVELQRVSAIVRQKRTVVFSVQLLRSQADRTVLYSEVQQVDVKDTGGVFVFEGPMAEANKSMEQIASPMSGTIEKVLVHVGQEVKAGDVLCTVSAMKMEVKVSTPCDGKVASIAVPAPGYRVVEGALLVTLK